MWGEESHTRLENGKRKTELMSLVETTNEHSRRVRYPELETETAARNGAP